MAVGLPDGKLLDEFDISHNAGGFKEFLHHIERLEKRHQLPVAVAMEDYNGWVRPLDGQILRHGYRLYSVNNLKLARYKEIFPAPAKTDVIDARRILELFRLSEHLPLAKNALHEVAPTSVENDQLKRTTRLRKQLVWERVRVINRLQSDLHAVCPGLMAITGEADNIWFLNFLTCRDKLTKLANLANLRKSSLLAIPGFGKTSMAEIAGEVGTLARFKSETGLAMYMGMSALDNSSGKKNGAKTPRHVNTRAKAAMMVAVARGISLTCRCRAPTTTKSVQKANSTTIDPA